MSYFEREKLHTLVHKIFCIFGCFGIIHLIKECSCSENALHIQIWTALLALLLLKWLHHLSQAHWSLSNLATMLRLNLFTYRDLRDWLKDPFGTPPLIPGPQQLALALA